MRFLDVLADPPVRYDPVSGNATQVHEYPKEVLWSVAWFDFIGCCVPVALLFTFDLQHDGAAAARVRRMQMDLPCSARSYGGYPTSQQFSFNDFSGLMIKFVIIH